MMALLDFYATRMRTAIISGIQYPLEAWLQLFGKFAEPVIYLIVWSTIAQHSGGSVGGYTVGEFAGYFIVWTLVRQMTVGWSPFAMEWRIRRGDFNGLMLRPMHPIHEDTAQMLGWKAIELIAVIPTMILLALLFRPELELQWWAVAAFFPALVLGFLSRYIFLYAQALTAFWTTRVSALFNLLFSIEFLISGRIAPLEMLPQWAQDIARALPFYWMFGFPLELIIGRVPLDQLWIGFGIQIAWVAVMTILLMVIWRAAVRQYSAVGG